MSRIDQLDGQSAAYLAIAEEIERLAARADVNADGVAVLVMLAVRLQQLHLKVHNEVRNLSLMTV